MLCILLIANLLFLFQLLDMFRYYYFNLTFFVADVFRIGIWSNLVQVEDPFLRRLASRLPAIALQSRQEGTVNNYLAAYIRWRDWASAFPEVRHLPADPLYVALYLLHISDSAKTHAPVSLAYYAISWAHRTAGLLDPTKDILPKMIKESFTRQLGHGTNKKTPITASMLSDIVNKHVHSSSDVADLRLASMCLLAFAGFLRFDELSHIRYSDLVFDSKCLKIFIEKSKTDIFRDGQWVYISRLVSAACPVAVLEKYLNKVGFRGFSDKFIFRAITRNKDASKRGLKSANKPLSYSTTRAILFQAFQAIGVDPRCVGTHSLRAGGATAAANNGVPDRLFKKHGRWLSDGSKDRYVAESIKHKLSVSQNLGL